MWFRAFSLVYIALNYSLQLTDEVTSRNVGQESSHGARIKTKVVPRLFLLIYI